MPVRLHVVDGRISKEEHPEEKYYDNRKEFERVFLKKRLDFSLVDGSDVLGMEHDEQRSEYEKQKREDLEMQVVFFYFDRSGEDHIHRDKQDDEQSDPLDLRIFVQIARDVMGSEGH